MTPSVGQRVMLPDKWFVPRLGPKIDVYREAVVVGVRKATKRNRKRTRAWPKGAMEIVETKRNRAAKKQ